MHADGQCQSLLLIRMSWIHGIHAYMEFMHTTIPNHTRPGRTGYQVLQDSRRYRSTLCPPKRTSIDFIKLGIIEVTLLLCFFLHSAAGLLYASVGSAFSRALIGPLADDVDTFGGPRWLLSMPKRTLNLLFFLFIILMSHYKAALKLSACKIFMCCETGI